MQTSSTLDRVPTLAWSVAVKGLARASEGAMAPQDVCGRSW
jgi:hypothetical protein